MVGNPNHDPKTGRFASRSGLNKSNSTITQRGKANIKEHFSAGKALVVGAGAAVVGAAGAAVLQGISRPIRARANMASHMAIRATEAAIAQHGPTIANAIKNKGSTLISHVKNMKSAGSLQHSSRSNGLSSDYRITPKRYRPSRNH